MGTRLSPVLRRRYRGSDHCNTEKTNIYFLKEQSKANLYFNNTYRAAIASEINRA